MMVQKFPIKSLVITGATSSIGIFIIDECIRRNIFVAAIYRFNSSNASRIPEHPGIKKYNCDLTNLKYMDTEGMQYDAFLHLAWEATKSIERNNLTPQVQNIQYALDAVELAERFGCHTFMGAGSQAEYGPQNKTLKETTSVAPSTAYGMAKLCAGQMTYISCRNKGIRHIWPRILSTYGPYSPYQTVLYYSIRELLSGRKPHLSKGEQIWDFLYLRDAARAILALMEKGKNGEIYLIASGISRSLKEFFIETRDMIDSGLSLGLGEISYTQETVMHLSADITKIKEETGWQPETSFADGIRETIEWVKSGGSF